MMSGNLHLQGLQESLYKESLDPAILMSMNKEVMEKIASKQGTGKVLPDSAISMKLSDINKALGSKVYNIDQPAAKPPHTKKPMLYVKEHDDPLNDLFDLIKIIPVGIGYQILKHFPKSGNHYLDSAKEMLTETSHQYLYAKGKRISPALFENYGFLRGASNIERYYTTDIMVNGAPIRDVDGDVLGEQPIYVKHEGNKDPSNEYFDKAIKLLIGNVKELDAFNKGLVKEAFDITFSYAGADDRLMNKDLGKREDPRNFWDMMSYQDCKNIQQMGGKAKIKDINFSYVDKSGVVNQVSSKVYVYNRPSPVITWAYGQTANNIYDFLDNLLFNPIQAMFGSSVAQEIPVKNQLKGVYQITDAIWEPFARNKPMKHVT